MRTVFTKPQVQILAFLKKIILKIQILDSQCKKCCVSGSLVVL